MILDEIIATKREEILLRKQRLSLAECRTQAESAPRPRDFAGALNRAQVALIGEIKRASPSRGVLRGEFDLPRLAALYEAYGVAAISVLTDDKYFGGSVDDLKSARVAVEVPILRKDFIVDEYMVYESRVLQADAILLIVRVLSDRQLCDYLALAKALGMGVLVEIHDEADLDRALAVPARVIGINNRNLGDFTVDLATTERLAPRIRAQARGSTGRIIVAESGIFTRADVERVRDVGAHAVLVGEALMRAQDVAAKAIELSGVTREGKGLWDYQSQ